MKQANIAKKIVTFGELMLRLAPPQYERIRHTRGFDICYAGGEANVAASLANYGMDAFFVSKIPTNDVGEGAIHALRAAGIQTAYVSRGGERLGIYFVEHGASVRPSKVIYDRAHSAIAQASSSDFRFEAILSQADWLHVTGITPALSPQCARLTEIALKTAKDMGITTSFDLNYRKKLWTPEQAQSTCLPLMEYVDVCIGNEEDTEKMLGVKIKDTDVQGGTLNIEGYTQACQALQQKFSFSYIATTLRESISASDNGWSALLYDGTQFYHSNKYHLHLVDRVGGGDAFSGGLIYALLTGKESQEAVDFAVAASALQQTIHGDFNQVSIAEIETLVSTGGSGRIVR